MAHEEVIGAVMQALEPVFQGLIQRVKNAETSAVQANETAAQLRVDMDALIKTATSKPKKRRTKAEIEAEKAAAAAQEQMFSTDAASVVYTADAPVLTATVPTEAVVKAETDPALGSLIVHGTTITGDVISAVHYTMQQGYSDYPTISQATGLPETVVQYVLEELTVMEQMEIMKKFPPSTVA